MKLLERGKESGPVPTTAQRLTLQALWLQGAELLAGSGIKAASLDARCLLFEAFHMDMAHFLLCRNDEVKPEESARKAAVAYWNMIEERSRRRPLQQIIGYQEFMGLDFYVNEHVLIPRQDTETLVEWVLADYRGMNPRTLDICAGSGCIGLSLAACGRFRDVTLTDVSAKALEVAKRNAKKLLGDFSVSIGFLEGDLFSGLDGENKPAFDLIVSNPPYIPTEVIEELEPEVRIHEPRLALDGMADGLYFYRRLAATCGRYLKPGGAVYFEIGWDQGELVRGLLRTAGFGRLEVKKDGAGNDRVVKGVL